MASILPLVIFLALSISIGATTTTSVNTISEPLLLACKQTPEPETCLKYLSKFPKSLRGNIQNITAVSVSAASFLAKEIRSFITLLKEETAFATPMFEGCLNSSMVVIPDIVGTLDELTKAVHDRSFANVSAWISHAWQDVTIANKSCMGHDGLPQIPQLSDYTDDLRKLFRIILVFFALIGN